MIFTGIPKRVVYFVLGLTAFFVWLLGKTFQKPRLTRWGANELFVEWAEEIHKFQYKLMMGGGRGKT